MRKRWNEVRLGRKKYTVYRDTGSSYNIYGQIEQGKYIPFEISANIQGSLVYNKMKLLDSGEQSKDSISIRSNQRLYKARIGDNGSILQADYVLFEGALWEVREVISYTNLRRTGHDEAIATRVDESIMDRVYEGRA